MEAKQVKFVKRGMKQENLRKKRQMYMIQEDMSQSILQKLSINWDYRSNNNEAKIKIKDQRKRFIDAQAQPYNCLGRVYSINYDQNTGQKIQGMGALVAPGIVLTAAHNFITKILKQKKKQRKASYKSSDIPKDSINNNGRCNKSEVYPSYLSSGSNSYKDYVQNDSQADQIYFYPFCRGVGSQENRIKIKKTWFSKKYLKKETQNNYDIAFLQLENHQFQKKDQYIKLRFNYNLQQNGDKLLICGYNDLSYQNQYHLLQQTDIINHKRDNLLFYSHTTIGGYSGTPLILITMKQNKPAYYVIGVHKGCAVRYNYGPSIDSLINNDQSQLSKMIQQWNMQKQWKQIYFSVQEKLKIQNQSLRKQMQSLKDQSNKKLKQKQEQLKQQQSETNEILRKFKIQQNKNENLERLLQHIKIQLNRFCQKAQQTQPNKINNFISQTKLKERMNALIDLLKSQEQLVMYLKMNEGQNSQQFLHKLCKLTIQKQQNHHKIKAYLQQLNDGNKQAANNAYGVMKTAMTSLKNQLLSINYFKSSLEVQLSSQGYFINHLNKKVDMNKFLSTSKYYHIEYLNFGSKKSQIDDKSFTTLILNAHKFPNMKVLNLNYNKINQIRQQDLLSAFKSLRYINLCNNPLSDKSIQQLKKVKQKRPNLQIRITNKKGAIFFLSSQGKDQVSLVTMNIEEKIQQSIILQKKLSNNMSFSQNN